MFQKRAQKACRHINLSCCPIEHGMISFAMFSDYNYLHFACGAMALVSLAKDYAERHYYEMSAKTKIPGSDQLTCGFVYYTVVLLLRLPTLILLMVCFQHWFPAFLAVAILTNGLLAFITLRPSFVKTVCTSVSAVSGPTCFMSKYKIHTMSHPGESFHR